MNGTRVNEKAKRNIWWILLCALLCGLTVGGCASPKPDDATSTLSFDAQMQINSEQEFHVSLGIKNSDQASFAGDDEFIGKMELRYADGDRAGELRARADIERLAKLEAGETAWPMSWRGQLDPGTYALTWGADRYGETHIQFQIVERDGRLYLGSWHQAQAQRQAKVDK